MIVFLLLLFLSLSFADKSVKFAAVIYRHGDRTPVQTYPTDPWKNESLWPVKFGELTSTGKRQHYALGQWLRKRYSGLLSEEFEPNEIYVRSTDVDRTLMSAQVNLAGMYPPRGKYIWDGDLMWQPIPVHTVPEFQDEVLAMKKPCPPYTLEMKKLVNSMAYKERLNKYQGLMNYVAACSGQRVKDYGDILDIYSTLYIETLYNFTLPSWTQSVYPEKLREPSCYSFSIPAATPFLSRLKVGPLMKDIVSKMLKSVNGSESLKVSIYSGHDLTIGNVLTALGLYDGKCPVYTSTILFELIFDSSTSSNFIRILYRNSTEIVEPYVLQIPFCGKLCPLERFIKLYSNLLTVNFDHECNKKFPVVITFLAVLGVLLAMFGYIKLISVRNTPAANTDSGVPKPSSQLLR